MKLLLLLVALGLAGASYPKNVCQPQSRPWQVHLHGGGQSCSGALIDPWWIVTSFSCAFTSSMMTASLGEHDVTVEEGTEQHIRVIDTILHTPYSPLHSLALVHLATPAHFNQYVQPIPLPSRCPKAGETCHVSGWGSTIPNQYEPSHRLKCITVPVVDDQTCRNLFPMHWGPGQICAGQENTDNCLNENGGVMVCDGQLQGVQWYAHGCSNPADPSIYTKLCVYNDWITDVINRFRPTEAPPVTS